jgi:hypothetical protein
MSPAFPCAPNSEDNRIRCNKTQATKMEKGVSLAKS